MITIDKISKTYNGKAAVDELSLDIETGTFFGILGPNGAGKTTLINLVTGILKPDSGNIFVNGKLVSKNNLKARKNIGYVPQDIALYSDLTVLQNLRFWGSFYQKSKTFLDARIHNLLVKIGLLDRKLSKVKSLSGGMKRRINLAVALLHDPEILVMDEPTVGIDPQSRILIHNILSEVHSAGCTILYTSHYLDEFEKLCDIIAIMDHGNIIASGSMDDLRRNYASSDMLLIELDVPIKEDEISGILGNDFQYAIKGERKLIIETDPGNKTIERIICKLEQSNTSIKNVEIRKSDLENLFFNLTGTELRN